MLPLRTTISGQSSALRKSRLEGKPSLLPKPRRPGSIDRQSMEARRPSASGHRSSSAEPRPTFGARLSREASATKLSVGRSRSQQGDRYGQVSVTPLRSSQYSIRPTTPRTPSEERRIRGWETSLERALAFVTVKDQRPISNPAWQRSEYARVQEALAARCPGGNQMVRPLSIARFVDITGALMAALIRESKLSTDNYVAKLPHLSKRLLYPGTLSKSWLKTVNTLHAFPNALALISYLLDMLTHMELPVSPELLYVDKSEQGCLKRDFLDKCWLRFQEPEGTYDDIISEYLARLSALLGDSEQATADLTDEIKQLEERLEESSEAAARADEARRVARRDALHAAVRATRLTRAEQRAQRDDTIAAMRECTEKLRHTEAEVERLHAQSVQVGAELDVQVMSVEERARLLDEVDYAHRVKDSKQTLVDEITKMVSQKETELALWQKKSLDACVEYKQNLLRLSARRPSLANLNVDEKELMGAECSVRVAHAMQTLRACSAELAEQCAEHARSKSALARRRAALLEETRAKISELQKVVSREQNALEADTEREAAEAAAWTAELQDLQAQIQDLARKEAEYERIDKELEFWEQQDKLWRSKLSEMRQYIVSYRTDMEHKLEGARNQRVKLVKSGIAKLTHTLNK